MKNVSIRINLGPFFLLCFSILYGQALPKSRLNENNYAVDLLGKQ